MENKILNIFHLIIHLIIFLFSFINFFDIIYSRYFLIFLFPYHVCTSNLDLHGESFEMQLKFQELYSECVRIYVVAHFAHCLHAPIVNFAVPVSLNQ